MYLNVDENKTQLFQMLQTTLNNHNFALYDQALNRLIHNKDFYKYMIHSFYTYIMSISKTKSNCDLIESLFTILTNKTLKIICEYVYFYVYKEDVNNNKFTFFVKTPEVWSIIKGAANNNGGSMLSFSCLDLNKKEIYEMFYAPEFGTLISIVLPNLEYLNMTKMNLKKLPKWTGDLRYIKYLLVSLNPLKKLPKSINNLGMLKTVVLPCSLRNTAFSENLKKRGVRALFVNETLSKENNSVELEGNGDFVSPLVLKNKNDF